jgi:hypothetical protein
MGGLECRLAGSFDERHLPSSRARDLVALAVNSGLATVLSMQACLRHYSTVHTYIHAVVLRRTTAQLQPTATLGNATDMQSYNYAEQIIRRSLELRHIHVTYRQLRIIP